MVKRRMADADKVTEPDCQLVNLEVPIIQPQDNGYQTQIMLYDQIHVTSLTQKQRHALRWILAGMRQQNVSMDDGKPVYQRADAIRYLLERLGDYVVSQ